MKTLLRSNAVLVLMMLAGLFAVLLAVCWAMGPFTGRFGGPQVDEVARIANRDGDLEVVVVEWDGGATTDVGHDVFVVERGRPLEARALVARFYGAHVNDRAWGIECRWAEGGSLVLAYDEARRADLVVPKAMVAGKVVAVQLAAGEIFEGLEGKMLERSTGRR